MIIEYTENDCEKIAQLVQEKVFKPLNSYKTTIFLCGADINDSKSLRGKIASLFGKQYLSYDVIYPEDIFDEILQRPRGYNLLTLENVLADSVDAIVIIVESAGSIAELGAFTNVVSLNGKVVCVLDKKYQKDKSFINKGPIKLIRKASPKKVIYLNPLNISAEMKRILTGIKEAQKDGIKKKEKITLLQLENFILPILYLTEPIAKKSLVKMVDCVTESTYDAEMITQIVLSILIKKKYIEAIGEGFKLNKHGRTHFLKINKVGKASIRYSERMDLDEIRLDILNLIYRNKKIGGRTFLAPFREVSGTVSVP